MFEIATRIKSKTFIPEVHFVASLVCVVQRYNQINIYLITQVHLLIVQSLALFGLVQHIQNRPLIKILNVFVGNAGTIIGRAH